METMKVDYLSCRPPCGWGARWDSLSPNIKTGSDEKGRFALCRMCGSIVRPKSIEVKGLKKLRRPQGIRGAAIALDKIGKGEVQAEAVAS